MKQVLLAVGLIAVTSGAFANGGLSIDNVKQVEINLPIVEVDRSALAQAPIKTSESYKGRMVTVDTKSLQHGSNV